MNEPIAPLNLAIIGLTVYCSYKGFTKQFFLERYLFSPEPILRYKQFYRLVSSGFLHADWVHLLFNMASLYSFGSQVELLSGPIPFLLIYFASILGGNLLSLILHRHHEYRALGASGGVCGIIFACVFLFPGTAIRFFLVPVAIPAHIYAVVFMLGSYFGIRSQRGNIGHDAHLGGAIIGLVTTTVLAPSIVTQNRLLYAAVMGLTIVLFVFLYKYPVGLHPTERPKVIKFPGKRFRKQLRKEQTDRLKDEKALDQLLNKVSELGIDALTNEERKQLEKISKRKRLKDTEPAGD
ncbi:MAG: rhomboid family intramembrane serine protease [Planctomycetota bacterium]|jgi:membrane associated rhomboid family serine protease